MQVSQFLQVHLLHWIETLSLIGKLSDGANMMTAL